MTTLPASPSSTGHRGFCPPIRNPYRNRERQRTYAKTQRNPSAGTGLPAYSLLYDTCRTLCAEVYSHVYALLCVDAASAERTEHMNA